MADYITVKRLEEKKEETDKTVVKLKNEIEKNKKDGKGLLAAARKKAKEMFELQDKAAEIESLIDEARKDIAPVQGKEVKK